MKHILIIFLLSTMAFGQSELLTLFDDGVILNDVTMASNSDSVKGHWVFDIQYAMNNSVDSVTKDLSSNANNLSSEFIYRSRMLGDSPVYKNGNTLTFDGGTKCLYIPAANAGDFEIHRDNFTIEAWVKTSSTALQYIISKHSSAENYFVAVRDGIGTAKIKLASSEDGGNSEEIFSDFNVADGEWHYVVWVIDFDNNLVHLYGDGQPKTLLNAYDLSTIDSIVTPTEDFCIGGIETTTAGVFDGNIAEVRFSNRALTGDEILTHYNKTLQLIDPVDYTPVNFEIAVFNDSLASDITYTQLQRLDNFTTKMKDSLSVDSLAEVFDIFYLPSETSEASLQNIINASHVATIISTPTFTANQGFIGNGSTYGINSNYNPSTQGVTFTLNSGSLGIYSRTNSTTTGYSVGSAVGGGAIIQYRLRVTGSNEHRYVLNGNSAEVTTYTGSTAGLFIQSRNSSNQTISYYNGLPYDTSTVVPSAVPNLNIYWLARNIADAVNTPDTRQISSVFMGRKLIASEVSKIKNCIEWYMDALGTGVIP